MTFGPDAIDRLLVANEARTSWMAEPSPVNLCSVGCVDIQVDQPGKGVFRFEPDATLFYRERIGIKCKDDIRPKRIM